MPAKCNGMHPAASNDSKDVLARYLQRAAVSARPPVALDHANHLACTHHPQAGRQYTDWAGQGQHWLCCCGSNTVAGKRSAGRQRASSISRPPGQRAAHRWAACRRRRLPPHPARSAPQGRPAGTTNQTSQQAPQPHQQQVCRIFGSTVAESRHSAAKRGDDFSASRDRSGAPASSATAHLRNVRPLGCLLPFLSRICLCRPRVAACRRPRRQLVGGAPPLLLRQQLDCGTANSRRAGGATRRPSATQRRTQQQGGSAGLSTSGKQSHRPQPTAQRCICSPEPTPPTCHHIPLHGSVHVDAPADQDVLAHRLRPHPALKGVEAVDPAAGRQAGRQAGGRASKRVSGRAGRRAGAAGTQKAGGHAAAAVQHGSNNCRGRG